ncbi:VOC family protein [Serpens gallinarum]|uniref:VOC family protein n=1 Tax=Serpens gallinarum TaxID=2763075 RepID=A0ABR8TPD5_9PSED|nr:VOC family protein [Serpens gallinarum]MBD7977632.1 VOC family protein [Serpens gallinarum]
MLSTAPVTLMLPVIDLHRARDFYEHTLGLRPEGQRPDGKFVYAAGSGTRIALFPKEGGTKADHTALSFEVANLESALQNLQQAGVLFEDYDLPGLKTVNHICVLGSEKAAWFKDTEGNYLCIHEDVSTP